MRYLLDSSEKVSYNNAEYYLRIRSNNLKNQVVLFLHGGCGAPDRGQIMKYQSSLCNNFTLVAWDQRGAGFAYDAKASKIVKLTKDLYVEDAHNVILYLKKRFNQDKIIIVGHSFGTALAVWLADKYPEDILAYVGVGQLVDYVENEKLSYAFTLKEAENRNDKKALRTLTEIGEPVDGKYSKPRHQKQQLALLHKYGGAVYKNSKPYWQELLLNDVPLIFKEYSLTGALKYLKGLMYCINSPLARDNPDFMNKVKSLDVPVYLLLGRHDYNCVSSLAETWLTNLTAPDKKLIWFENSAHQPQWEETNLWNDTFTKLFIK